MKKKIFTLALIAITAISISSCKNKGKLKYSNESVSVYENVWLGEYTVMLNPRVVLPPLPDSKIVWVKLYENVLIAQIVRNECNNRSCFSAYILPKEKWLYKDGSPCFSGFEISNDILSLVDGRDTLKYNIRNLEEK